MLTQRQLFLNHVAQTSPAPMGLNVARAEGVWLYDVEGKRYLDLIAGISVSSLGHCHPRVVDAVRHQAGQYMHLMVYGEYIYSPQVSYTSLLASYLPSNLSSVYLVNSGAEATEGAMKLAKRFTGRQEIVYFSGSYHGSTQGALSIMGNEDYKRAYRPLLPDTRQLRYGNVEDLAMITSDTAAVFFETVQAETGITVPSQAYVSALRKRCDETGALLVMDEIQVGFGRTGSLFAFEQYGVVPDILLLAKAMGGGMPIGAFVSSLAIMNSLTENPVLGHITTFGGHPVSCAAAKAALEALIDEGYIATVKEKETLLLNLLKHPAIKSIRSKGLIMALEFDSFENCKRVIDLCLAQGVITDWFLHAPNCLRIAPPLIIQEDELRLAADVILSSIDKVFNQ